MVVISKTNVSCSNVKVNTTITKGKTKRFGRTLGRRSDVKKAYVTLKAGQDVEMADLGDTAESAAE